jgi:hypothetical protein
MHALIFYFHPRLYSSTRPHGNAAISSTTCSFIPHSSDFFRRKVQIQLVGFSTSPINKSKMKTRHPRKRLADNGGRRRRKPSRWSSSRICPC